MSLGQYSQEEIVLRLARLLERAEVLERQRSTGAFLAAHVGADLDEPSSACDAAGASDQTWASSGTRGVLFNPKARRSPFNDPVSRRCAGALSDLGPPKAGTRPSPRWWVAYATASSPISERQRMTKSRRCSARELSATRLAAGADACSAARCGGSPLGT